jgi:hypothetical protein
MQLAIGGVALIVLAALAAAVVLVMQLRTRATALDAAGWAQRFCSAEAAYVQANLTLNDGVDPSTLAMDARKQRADRVGKAQITAAADLSKALKSVVPPEAARAFHDARIRDADEEVSSTREQLDAFSKATNAQQLVLANTQWRFRRDASAQTVAAAEQALPPDVVAALDAEAACRQLPPVQPTQRGVPSTRGPA